MVPSFHLWVLLITYLLLSTLPDLSGVLVWYNN